jgi:HK97 family phage portal protein
VFGKQKEPQGSKTSLRMMSGYTPIFTDFNGEAYDSDVVRSVVDTIARHAGKFKPKHIRYIDGTVSKTPSNLEDLLGTSPNPYMDTYNFLYKVVTHLYMNNNAFILIQQDSYGNITGFYPINSTNVELLESGKEVFVKFRFISGEQLTVPYSQVIHLRRFFNRNDFYGEYSTKPLNPVLELINTTNQGIINAIKSSAYLRGLLKFTQAYLKPEDIKKQRDDFVNDYMTMSNNGGIAATDAKADYVELKSDPKMVDANQMKLIEDKVYKFFNVSENIVKSNYTEDEFNAFFESILEPIAIQFSLQFTYKVFTKRERGFGNSIVFEANRLQYASNKTKVEILKTAAPIGLMTLNEMREIFNMAPIEGGDKRVQSLNFVDADKANQYQLNNKENTTQDGGATDGTNQDSTSTDAQGQGVSQV